MLIVIGERSEPPSDKLGGEMCIASRALVHVCLSLVCMYVCMYVYGVRMA